MNWKSIVGTPFIFISMAVALPVILSFLLLVLFLDCIFESHMYWNNYFREKSKED